MKRLFASIFALACLVQLQAQDFKVTDYHADITIHEDGYFDVVERYDVVFEAYKHGIYRTIQTVYDVEGADGRYEKRRIDISKVQVPGHRFETTSGFEKRLNSSFNIRIGNPNLKITGAQQYEIRYRVRHAFLFEDDRIRFYWNIKPDGWYANFERVRFTIHAPEGIRLSSDNSFVYSGPRGTTSPSQSFDLRYAGNELTAESMAGELFPGNSSVTLLMNLPADAVARMSSLSAFWNRFGWSVIMALMIGTFYFVWRRYGKDDPVVATTSYYPPEGISPAMAGYLVNDRVDSSDLISLIPHWGSLGLLKIEDFKLGGIFGGKDTRITFLGELPDDAPPYERLIYNGLYNRSSPGSTDQPELLVSSLKDRFYKTMSKAHTSLHKQAQIYYSPLSKSVQLFMYVGLVLFGIGLGFLSLYLWGILGLISVVITTIVLLILNFFMIRKNAKGTRLMSELKGFQNFIKLAEGPKLKMLLTDDPNYFESTMGYALAFGMFKQWAGKFDSLGQSPPQWYSSSHSHGGMDHFTRSFNSSMAGVGATMVSSPSSSGSSGSSGGGSSGGGFGGGGGGSW